MDGFVLTAVLGRGEVIGLFHVHTYLEHQELYMSLVSLFGLIPARVRTDFAHGALSLLGSVAHS